MNNVDKMLKEIEEICLATWEPLYRFIYYKVQNREEAEDITQETYTKTLTNLPEYKSPLSYMKAVALNILRDRWRQKKRRGIPVNFEEINPAEAASEDHQKLVAQRIQLENAIAKLNETQRSVLDLRIIKGYSVAETAKLTGKSEAAVRTTQCRALQTLAKILEDDNLSFAVRMFFLSLESTIYKEFKALLIARKCCEICLIS